jgi:hypothetical protein
MTPPAHPSHATGTAGVTDDPAGATGDPTGVTDDSTGATGHSTGVTDDPTTRHRSGGTAAGGAA